MAKQYKRKRKKPKSRHFRINTATLIALAVFGYLVVRMVMSMTQPTISTYEVTTQRIYDKISTTALAVRSEEVVTTKQAGYVTYYVADGERVGVNSKIYAIDPSGSVQSALSGEDGSVELSDDNYLDLKNQIIDYKNTYQDASFGTIYDFKYALDNNIMEISNDSIISKMDDLISSGAYGSSLNQITAGEAGVVSYCYDGLESTTTDTLSHSLFQNTDNDMKQMRSTLQYEQGAPVYRLVTDENWSLVAELTEEQYQRVKSEQYLKVKFLKDDLTVTRGVTFSEQDGAYYAILSFNKYMERYMDDRYLDIELVLDSIDGLKIPNSSLLQEELYSIPMDYAVQSDEVASGIAFIEKVTDKDGETDYEIIAPNICYMDEKAGYYYVSPVDLSEDTVLVKTSDVEDISSSGFNGSETYTIGETKEFEGVYTINKGYAQFVVITNLYQADDFCIAQSDEEYGISAYDHVVLESAALKEGQVIY